MSRVFHIGDVLSVIHGQILSPRGVAGVEDILTYMTGEKPRGVLEMFEAIVRCRSYLAEREIYPKLFKTNTSEIWHDSMLHDWVCRQGDIYGCAKVIVPIHPEGS